MRGFAIAVLLGLAVDVTSGQRIIQLIPQYPVINGSVTLRVTGITEAKVNCIWYKGPNTNVQYVILGYFPGIPDPTVPGSQYNPRITAFSNGSLQIKDLQMTDGGNYIVKIQTVSTQQDTRVTLTVYDLKTGNDGSVGLALGLASAIILGVVLIIVGSFCLYKKFATRRLNESLENRQKDIEVYENVQAPQVKEESSYMDLQTKSEDAYTELRI